MTDKNTILIEQVPAVRVLGVRLLARNHLHFARVCAEVRVAAQAQSIPVVGYPLQILYAAQYAEDEIDTEFALPVAESWAADVPLAGGGVMTVHTLPAVQAITYQHGGDLWGINDRLPELERAADEQGYQLADSMRFIFRRGFVDAAAERVFDVQHVLRPIG